MSGRKPRAMDHRDKLAWARKHLVALEEAIDAFPKSEPYEARTQRNPTATRYVARFYVTKEIPREWGLILGDIFHNMRSALDSLAYALA